MQEMGRAGRDGLASMSTVYVNASDIGNNRTFVSNSVREFVQLTTCRRKYLIEYFGSQYFAEFACRHLCCDNCAKECECDECQLSMAIGDFSIESEKVDNSVKTVVFSVLSQYFDCENSTLASEFVLPAAVSGLSMSFAKQLSANYIKYNNSNAIISDFPYLDIKYVPNIVDLIRSTSIN